mmetsp:Transcript_35052/g.80705  ORF Transcript_35052/g.80705 Transcript_35052/m.80705 type:complete len:697 (-) Transcript_35052:222-2312(-)
MGGGAETATSATARWLEWQAQTKVKGPATSTEEPFPSHFSLDGPMYYLRAGKPEVGICYFGTGGNLLLMGPKWNVVLDYIDVSHLKTCTLGSTVCLYGGRDIVLRLFLPTPEKAQEWCKLLTAASFGRVSDQYMAQLNMKIQKQQKAERRARQAAAFGAIVESFCARSVYDANRRLKALLPTHNEPLTIAGEHHVYPARFYIKDYGAEAAGRISIHGDTLIMQWAHNGKVLKRAIVLTGATATIAVVMVSVRGADGLAKVRLWMNDEDEAEEISKAVEEAAKASSSLIKRTAPPTASTMRRQLGLAVAAMCSTTAKVQASAATPSKTAELPSNKFEPGAFCLDGKCYVFLHKATDARFCHCTLRGDMLWFGEKASISDQVLSVIGAKAVATGDMVIIKAPNGGVYRLWPDASAGTPAQWCQAIQDAGNSSAHLSKWEAMIKAEKCEAFAKKEVRRLDRARRFRNLGERLIYMPAKLTGLVHADRRCAMEVFMDWQQSSRLAQKKEVPADANVQKARFYRRAAARGKPLDRTLQIMGDVLFVFAEEDKMETPVPLAGATIFSNQAIVSIWVDGVLQARMFLDTEESAERWSGLLEKATTLLTDTPDGQKAPKPAASPKVEPESTPAVSAPAPAAVLPLNGEPGETVKVAMPPPKMSKEDHETAQKLQKTRSRRFYSEDASSGKTPEAGALPETAVGA